MKRERVAPARPRKSDDTGAVRETGAVRDTGAVRETGVEDEEIDLLNDIDELLDEIDAVLEDQAVLIGFRQRSGQ
jgi:hypothetical protein